MKQIIEDIVESFGALWKFHQRGDSIEITVPSATANNMFVTLFLTRRDDLFIVTDGGTIDRGVYDTTLPMDDECFEKLFRFYLEDNAVMVTRAKGRNYYFKQTPDARLVANAVFDMAVFVQAVVSASFIQFQSEKEKRIVQRFRTQASEFIRSIFPDKVQTNTFISPSLSTARFNAIVTNGGQFSLINFITGSTDAYFIRSLSLSNLNFDLIDSDPISQQVKSRIALVDNSARAYTSAKAAPYLNLLSGHKNRHIVAWENRQSIESLI